MLLNPLTTTILRHYLLRLPLPQRISKYQSLMAVEWLQKPLAQIKPEVLPKDGLTARSKKKDNSQKTIQPLPLYYGQYQLSQVDPLDCRDYISQSEAPASPTIQYPFPPCLTPEQQLTGQKGQYQISQSLGRRGISRLYGGVDLDTEEPIIIQEFLLPSRYFSPAEQRHYQEQFMSLAGITLADGRSQDLRIVNPIDTIVDPGGERCYLITLDFNRTATLNQYCAQQGPFNESMVRDLLNQALQTLTFLHQQRFIVPTGQIQQGVIHGNINLNSLLWSPNQNGNPPHGFVYITDFHLWTSLFDPATIERADLGAQDELSIQDDLQALGKVAFWILHGTTVDDYGSSLDPRLDRHWPKSLEKELKLFLQQLMGITSTFESAEIARDKLLKLRAKPVINQIEKRVADRVPLKKPWYQRGILLGMLCMLALAGLGGLLWWILWQSKRTKLLAQPISDPCCLKAVDGIPSGNYTYAIPESAYWQPLFQPAPNSQDRTKIIENTPGLLDKITQQQSNLSFQRYYPKDDNQTNLANTSIDDAVVAVQTGQADFAIIPMLAKAPIDVTATIIAYDSLVPIVAFSYSKRNDSLPTALRGKMTIAELEGLYTNKINNWNKLSSVNLPVRSYWPDDKINQEIFQQLFVADRENRTEANALIDKNQFVAEMLPMLSMFRRILQDFENNNTGSIAIAPLSQVFGQCSVYPLAFEKNRQATAPLIFDTGAVVTPESDLCDRKGSYFPHGKAFREGTYPLAYPLVIVYPLDNTRSAIGKSLAQLLLTQESQTYLETSGMVAAHPRQTSINPIWK